MTAVAMQMPIERFVELWPELQCEMDKVAHAWDPWFTKPYVFNAVMAGQWQVWAAGFDGSPRMFLFTQIVFYPAAKVLQGIFVLGNSLDSCMDAIWAATEQFARENDCVRMEVLGRRGWERKLSHFGFRNVGVTLSVPVNTIRTQ